MQYTITNHNVTHDNQPQCNIGALQTILRTGTEKRRGSSHPLLWAQFLTCLFLLLFLFCYITLTKHILSIFVGVLPWDLGFIPVLYPNLHLLIRLFLFCNYMYIKVCRKRKSEWRVQVRLRRIPSMHRKKKLIVIYILHNLGKTLCLDCSSVCSTKLASNFVIVICSCWLQSCLSYSTMSNNLGYWYKNNRTPQAHNWTEIMNTHTYITVPR